MKRNTPKEPRLISYAIKFHDSICLLALRLSKELRPQKQHDTDKEVSEANMTLLVHTLDHSLLEQEKDLRRTDEEPRSLESKLQTFGQYHIEPEELEAQTESVLFKSALAYDKKGIIPAPHEELPRFVYRANTLLYLHGKMKKHHLEPTLEIKLEEGFDIKLFIENQGKLIKQKDLEEANKRIPHDMDLTWVAAFTKRKKEMILPALGLTYTLPQFNGFNFIQMLSEYKTREQYLSVLAHEMTHAGTVHLDTNKKYLETKAYAVGRGSLLMGEYVVATNAHPGFLMKTTKFIFENFFHIPLPEKILKSLPKIRSLIEIADNTRTYKKVGQELEGLYGEKGSYVLGRLNAEEIEEFRDTNDIKGRIALKDDLKWNIMKEHLYP